MNSKKVRIISLILVLLMLIGAVGAAVVPTFAASESALQAQIEKLEKEQKELQNKINSLSKDQKKQKEYQEALNSQIESLEKQIESLNSQITLYNNKITAKEKEITLKSADIDENFELMKERLAAMQLAGDNSLLMVIFSAENFTDLLTHTEMIQSVAERDQKLINRLASEKADIEAAKKEIEDSKAKVESSQKTLSAKKSTLDTSYAKSEKYMAAINAEKVAYQKDKAKLDKEEAAAQAELQKLYESMTPSGSLSPGGWMWPFSSKRSYISSGYGWRWNNTDYHKGIDISNGNSYGVPIVASKKGTVIKTVKTSPSTGYGNYVIIDHGKGSDGNGYSTLYAHASQVLVSVGDTVKQGQVIAKAGNTGNSFGAHLHFEVRINGKHTNPLNYVKKT